MVMMQKEEAKLLGTEDISLKGMDNFIIWPFAVTAFNF
jgi:hypothetical protein